MARALMRKEDAQEWLERIGEVEELRGRAGRMEACALERAGWAYTSDTLGSYWLWTKRVGARVFVLRKVGAIMVQQRLAMAAVGGS